MSALTHFDSCPDQTRRVDSSYAYGISRPITSVCASLGLRFDDVVGAFKSFKGDNRRNVRAWIQHFEQQTDEFQFSSIQKFIFAKRLLKDDAKLFLEFESKATTWATLKMELIEEFDTKINSALVHQRLRERKKKPNESIMSYLYEMLTIASLGDIDTPAIITYTVDGLPESSNVKGFMYEATTLKEFKAKIRSYEILRGRNFDQSECKQPGTSAERCMNCGAKNHNTVKCPDKDKGRRYFRCNSFGHMSANCKAEQDESTKRINFIQRVESKIEEDEEESDAEMFQDELEKMHKKFYFQSKSS